MVRAKFYVRSKELYANQGGGTVKLGVVYSGSDENKSFFKYTPSGEISLNTINEEAFAQFELGKEFYVDFTKVEG